MTSNARKAGDALYSTARIAHPFDSDAACKFVCEKVGALVVRLATAEAKTEKALKERLDYRELVKKQRDRIEELESDLVDARDLLKGEEEG